MAENAIEIHGVTKRFREKVAVDRLDLVVPTGSLCGFVGPNGAGKTTTIRMVMSIFFPDAGEIRVLGKSSAIESKDRIGYLPEERGVYRKAKVGDFLTYIARLKGVPGAGLVRKIDDWLEKIALPGVRRKRCEELSKGMQQKVQFLAAIIHDPDLIILDEPFSGLDPVNSRLMRQLIDEMHRNGKTIIFSTHVLHSAEQLCSRIFMIDKGRKLLDGSMEAIRAQFSPRTVVVEPVEGPGYEVALGESDDPRGVMQGIINRDAVRRIELRRATLEDIFVRLVDSDESGNVVRSMVGSGGDQYSANADA